MIFRAIIRTIGQCIERLTEPPTPKIVADMQMRRRMEAEIRRCYSPNCECDFQPGSCRGKERK